MKSRSLYAALIACLTSAPAGAQLVLEDVASEYGVGGLTFGRGAAMADLDGDGDLDLIATSAGTDNLFYRQKSNHKFISANVLWAIPTNDRQSWSVLAADFDNDGDLDVYFANGGYGPAEPNQLLRNDVASSGVFVDVSASSGDLPGLAQTFGASAGDFDLDGFVDILEANHKGPCRALINDGGLVFDDAPVIPPGHESSQHRHTGAGDYDNDGWLDVGVGVFDGPNILLHNQGGQAGAGFEDTAASAGVDSPAKNFGFVWQDFDQDGWLDVYLPKYQLTPVAPSRLFLNQGGGSFLDVTAQSGMTGQDDMGHDSGDLDGDGFAEIYIGTGNPTYLALDLMFAVKPDGVGGLTATDISGPTGIQSIGPTRNHGMAMGDFDEDGDVDVFASLGGPSSKPDTIETNALWLNEGNANAWIEVALTGVISDRGAIGARGKAVLASGREVYVHHQVGRGFGNTPSPIQHFGLGGESAVERLEIRWPSGIVQTLVAPQAFTRHALIETGLLLHGQPAIGGTIEVEACGPALDVATLAYGPNPGSLAMGPLGVLLLAPPIFPGPTIPLGPSGRQTLSIPVPMDPMLSGLSFVLQAWIHHDGPAFEGVLSNALTIAFP